MRHYPLASDAFPPRPLQIQASILPVEAPLVQDKLKAVEAALQRGLTDLNWRRLVGGRMGTVVFGCQVLDLWLAL